MRIEAARYCELHSKILTAPADRADVRGAAAAIKIPASI
jgi:hypothetical protein